MPRRNLKQEVGKTLPFQSVGKSFTEKLTFEQIPERDESYAGI